MRNKKNSKRSRISPKVNKVPLNLPAYPGQVVKTFKLPLTPFTVVTTVTTGQIAAFLLVQASAIQNFATRFGSLFEEYRIVKVRFWFKTFSSSNPGLLTHWIDEKDQTAPIASEAKQKSALQFSAADPSPHVLTWTARDPLDLQYTDIGTTTVTPVTYKLFTNNADFGSSPVSTPYGTISSQIWVQFRGLN